MDGSAAASGVLRRAAARTRRVLGYAGRAAWYAPDRAVPAPRLLTVVIPAHPRARRVLAAAGIAGVAALAWTAELQLNDLVFGSLGPLAWALAALQVFPLTLAAARPLTAWRISSVGMVLTTFAEVGHAPSPFWPWTISGCVAYLLMVFCAALAHGRDIAIGMDLLTACGVLLPAFFLVGLPPVVMAVAAVAVTLVLVVGESVHSRQEAERHLVRAEEQRRLGLARQAVLEERARIARELHDVVAHHMSMIAIQAEAAPYKQPGLPEKTLRTFGAIREASTTALTEMRRVIGLLREEDGQDVQRAPQPGIRSIPDMVRAARTAGMRVDLTLAAGHEPVPAVVDVSAYRIVQEALSNAGRHAPGATVEVEVVHGPGELLVRVSDDGVPAVPDLEASPPPPPAAGGGHGLTGMRERALMLGGTLAAGRREHGGFQVTAVLPLDGPSPEAAGTSALGALGRLTRQSAPAEAPTGDRREGGAGELPEVRLGRSGG
ncbi:sensor histidine kinase [Phaeacidiphilus oryzae]|uniref:sensor histidine kinase n=1 Tax=Phaeacidiphilus oryzae TaxID=348818 RepID=UPI00068D7A97|nr:histidine kinase [Phaeacidiphilus oryzae]